MNILIPIESKMEVFARTYSKDTGVTVSIGSTACTDGQKIYVPPIPDQSDPFLRLSTEMFVYHETGHVRTKDFPAFDAYLKTGDKTKSFVFNIVRDVVVEHSMETEYPGLANKWTEFLTRFIKNKTNKEMTGSSTPVLRKLLITLYIRCREKLLGADLRLVLPKEIKELYEAKLAKYEPEVIKTKSVQASQDLTERIFTDLKDALPPPKPKEKKPNDQKSPKKDKQDQSEDSDDTQDEGEDSGQSEDEPSDSADAENDEGTGTGEETEDPSEAGQDASDGSENPEGDKEDAQGEDPDGSGDDEAPADSSDDGSDGDESPAPGGEEDDSEGSEDESGPGSSGNPEEGTSGNTEPTEGDTDKGTDKDASDGDSDDQLSEEAEDALKQAQKEMDQGDTGMTISEDAADQINKWIETNKIYREDIGLNDRIIRQDERPLWELEVTGYETKGREMTGYIGKRLKVLFISERAPQWNHNLRSGKLDCRKLHKLSRGSLEVCKRKVEGVFEDSAVWLVIDNSGSMDSKREIAQGLLTSLSSDLDKLRIPFGAVGFTSNSEGGTDDGIRHVPCILNLMKDFDEPYRRVRHRFVWPKSTNGTAEFPGIKFGAYRLATRRETKKVLFILTDGQTATGSDVLNTSMRIAMKEYIHRLVKAGVKVVGIGILDDSLEEYCPDFILCNDLRTFAAEFYSKLTKIIL